MPLPQPVCLRWLFSLAGLVGCGGMPSGTPSGVDSGTAPGTDSGGGPPPTADAAMPPPTSPGWTLIKTFDLSTDEGWSYTTGVRTTDQSYNRKEQVTFGANGMTVTAERASEGATIYSADAKAMFEHMPTHFAIEADITLTGLGSGMFPAFWARPNSGQGELDFWEYCGVYLGTAKEMKSTVIKTGSGAQYNLGSKAFGIPKTLLNGGSFEGKHTWRYEKTANQVALFVDGNHVGDITQAQFDASAGSGSWNSQFEAGQTWYPRLTFQVGPGTAANLAGPIPSAWRQSTMKVSRMVVYQGQ